jgi:hypothetical protein
VLLGAMRRMKGLVLRRGRFCRVPGAYSQLQPEVSSAFWLGLPTHQDSAWSPDCGRRGRTSCLGAHLLAVFGVSNYYSRVSASVVRELIISVPFDAVT